jgi:hypothetical protein
VPYHVQSTRPCTLPATVRCTPRRVFQVCISPSAHNSSFYSKCLLNEAPLSLHTACMPIRITPATRLTSPSSILPFLETSSMTLGVSLTSFFRHLSHDLWLFLSQIVRLASFLASLVLKRNLFCALRVVPAIDPLDQSGPWSPETQTPLARNMLFVAHLCERCLSLLGLFVPPSPPSSVWYVRKLAIPLRIW